MNDATIERYLKEDEDEALVREKKFIGKSPWQLAFSRLSRNRLAMLCFAVIVAYVATAVATSFDIFGVKEAATVFNDETLAHRFVPMGSPGHILGTDGYGRDVLARCVLGIKVSLFLAFVAGILTIPIAVVTGSVAGYYGGWVDEIAQYLMSIIVAIPSMLIIMSLIAMIGKSYFTIAFAFAVTGWVGLARVVRGTFIQAREFEYVLAAKALGASDARIIFKHILPNVFHFVIVSFVLHFVSVIKSEVFLAYVGLSMVGVPTWGSMIDISRNEVINGDWQNLVGPTLFMFIFLTCLNIFGDALRDALDPKLRNL